MLRKLDKAKVVVCSNWLSPLVIGLGAMIAWSSPSLHYLTSNESEIPVNAEEAGWITSLANIGGILGYLTIPLLMDRIGRKNTLLIFAIPQAISWLLIVLGKSVITLCIARTICGFGYSCISLISVYIGEIAEQRIRGMLSISMVTSGDIGVLLVATLGAYLSYQTMNLVLLSLPIIFFVSFTFMPESPYFYMMKGREEEAVKSLMRLRGVKNPDKVKSEMTEIRNAGTEKDDLKKNKLQELFSGGNRKGLMIVVFLHVVSMFSGSIAMLAYAHQIFEYSGFELTSAHSYMILGFVKTLSCIVASQLVETMGRRVLHMTSGIFSTIALVFVGVYFFMKLQLEMDVSSISWLPLAGLVVFEIAASAGIGPIPFVLGGELFPLRLKNVATVIIFVAAALASFVVELMFPILKEAFGVHVIFFIFAFCCLFGTLSIFRVMPETKGKSLEEIQFILNSKRKKNSS